jgi:hypothetical protein
VAVLGTNPAGGRDIDEWVDEPLGADEVRLRVPAHNRYLCVVRMAASAVGAIAGFDLERLDDLRLATDELTATLLRDGTGAFVHLSLRAVDASVVAEGWIEAGATAAVEDRERREARARILAVIADRHGLVRAGRSLGFFLEIRRDPGLRTTDSGKDARDGGE